MLSAVTYSTAFTLVNSDSIDAGSTITGRFLLGWLFVLLCQLSAHLLGEYYDYEADKLTLHTSPFTGGSRVLTRHPKMRNQCGILGWTLAIIAALLLLSVLPASVRSLGLSIILLATQYSGAPLRFNHRYLGELSAAIVMNVVLPLFAAQLALPSSSSIFTHHIPNLLLLIAPSALIKFALFLVLNLADKCPDWLAGKNTLPVLLDAPRTALLHALVLSAAYVSVPVVLFLQRGNNSPLSYLMAALIFASAPRAYTIACKLRTASESSPSSSVVFFSLQHAPLPLLAIFASCFIYELSTNPSRVFTIAFHLRLAAIYPYMFLLFQCRPPPSQPAPEKSSLPSSSPILIVGGGVSGLVMAIALHQLGRPYVLLERRSKGTHDDGADLGLWPSGVSILRALHVPASFFDDHTYPVKRVHMRTTNDELLQDLSMDEVVKGTGDHFRLIGRQKLLAALHQQLPPDAPLHYDCQVIDIHEDSQGVTVHATVAGEARTFKASIVVGADGINSVCRRLVLGRSDGAVRQSGEVCYRGLCSLASPALRELFTQQKEKNAMTLLYGSAMRASYGVLDGLANEGYWWIKVPADSTVDSWPAPFAELRALTPASHCFMHSVVDRMPSSRWCSARCVLVGDAAHPVTPNMAQGANMAIEDSLVLATLLTRLDHQEAFYQYVRLRLPHATRVANESYRQSKIGQWQRPVMVRLRNTLLRLVPSSVLQRKLTSVNIWPKMEEFLEEFKRRTATIVQQSSPEPRL